MATRFPNYLLERWVEKSYYMKADLSIHKFQYQKEKLPFSATLGISHYSPFATFVTRLTIHVRVILLRNAMSLSVSLLCTISTVEKVMRWKSANIRGAFDIFKIFCFSYSVLHSPSDHSPQTHNPQVFAVSEDSVDAASISPLLTPGFFEDFLDFLDFGDFGSISRL